MTSAACHDRSMASRSSQVADVAAVLRARVDLEQEATEIAEILGTEDEILGSALDVFDAVGHLLGDDEDAAREVGGRQ